jgi:hypothetical protein
MYVIAVTDADAQVVETIETNNLRTVLVSVAAGT